MATLLYYTYQDNRKNGTSLWYGKCYHASTITLEQVAERIEQNCSMKKSDVLAYLTELIEAIDKTMKDGFKVSLGDLGTFQIGITSKGALTKKEYKADKHYIKGAKVRHVPCGSHDDGVYTRATLPTAKVHFQKVEPYRNEG